MIPRRLPFLSPNVLMSLVLLGAFALRVACGLHYTNLNHPDEIFQYIEPAHRAVFGYGIVAWEFKLGGRSWLVPGVIAGIIKAATFVSDDPWVYLGAIAVAMSALSLAVVWAAFRWGYGFFGRTGAVITATVAAVWPELVYFAPKTLTGVIGTDAFVIAAVMVYPNSERRNRRAFFFAGVFLGLAFAVRFEIAPVLALFAVLVCRLGIKSRWLPLIGGGAVPLLGAGLLDAVTWGVPFQSIIVQLQNAPFVAFAPHLSSPWYYYFGVLTLNWSGAIGVLLITAALGARRLPVLAIVAAFMIGFYSLIGMKLYRYVYPALPFIIILAGMGTSEIVVWLAKSFPRRAPVFTGVAIAGWVVTSAALMIDDHMQVYLNKDGAILASFERIGRQSDLCGLGVVGVPWWRTGGYTYLHRDVPIYVFPYDRLAEQSAAVNYLIVQDAPPIALPFERERCTENAGFTLATRAPVCVYHRAGMCKPSSAFLLQNIVPKRAQ
jgi:GPI mannosyltransferase 3